MNIPAAIAFGFILIAVPQAHANPISIESLDPTVVLNNFNENPPPGTPFKAGPTERLPVPFDEELQSGRFESAPDFDVTPGVLCTPQDKDFDKYRYPEQIPWCIRKLTVSEKKVVSKWYGIAWEDHLNYQYDHLLSLCLGGSNSLRNIWPMPWDEARSKAKMEAELCRRLAAGKVTQKAAVREELGWFSENAPQMLPLLKALSTP